MAYFGRGRNPLSVQLQMQPDPKRSMFIQQLLATALQNNGRGSRSLAESLDIASSPIVAALMNKWDKKAELQQQQQRTDLASQLIKGRQQAAPTIEDPAGGPSTSYPVPYSTNDPRQQALASILAQNPQAMSAMALQQAMPQKPSMTPHEAAQIGLDTQRVAIETQRLKDEENKQAVQPNVSWHDAGDKLVPKLPNGQDAPGIAPIPKVNQQQQAAGTLTPEAIRLAAETYRTTGRFPQNMSRNAAMQALVQNEVAKQAAAVGDTAGVIAARTAARSANQESLNQTAKMEAASKGFLGTIEKNADSLLALQGKVDSSGVPILNKAIRAWQQGITGDKDVATYVTYLTSIQGEFAKMKSGSLGNVAASDAAMRDAADTINKFMSQQGIEGALIGIKQEGQNRLAALAETRQAIMNELGQGAPSQGVPSTNQPSPAQSQQQAPDPLGIRGP